jgi:hypothetical protein
LGQLQRRVSIRDAACFADSLGKERDVQVISHADEERAVLQLAAAGFGPRVGRKAGDLIILSPTGDPADARYIGDSGQEIPRKRR